MARRHMVLLGMLMALAGCFLWVSTGGIVPGKVCTAPLDGVFWNAIVSHLRFQCYGM